MTGVAIGLGVILLLMLSGGDSPRTKRPLAYLCRDPQQISIWGAQRGLMLQIVAYERQVERVPSPDSLFPMFPWSIVRVVIQNQCRVLTWDDRANLTGGWVDSPKETEDMRQWLTRMAEPI